MGISVQEQMLIEQRVTNDAKSLGVAYLLWVFLSGLGAHRFYLGRTGSAIIMVVLFVLGIITGGILLVPLFIWALIDAFLIPGIVQKQKEETRLRLTTEAIARN